MLTSVRISLPQRPSSLQELNGIRKVFLVRCWSWSRPEAPSSVAVLFAEPVLRFKDICTTSILFKLEAVHSINLSRAQGCARRQSSSISGCLLRQPLGKRKFQQPWAWRWLSVRQLCAVVCIVSSFERGDEVRVENVKGKYSVIAVLDSDNHVEDSPCAASSSNVYRLSIPTTTLSSGPPFMPNSMHPMPPQPDAPRSWPRKSLDVIHIPDPVEVQRKTHQKQFCRRWRRLKTRTALNLWTRGRTSIRETSR